MFARHFLNKNTTDAAPSSVQPTHTLAPLGNHTIEISLPLMTWAKQVASTADISKLHHEPNRMIQRQAYLRALSAAGFTTWINATPVGSQGSPSRSDRKTYHATCDQLQATGVCEMGGHRIVVLPVIGLPNAQISIPKAVLSDRSICLFVLVELQLDEAWGIHQGPTESSIHNPTAFATVLTGLRRDHLELQQQMFAGDDYLVEMTQFDLVPEQVQLYLEGLCKGLITEETAAQPVEAMVKAVQPLSSCRPASRLCPIQATTSAGTLLDWIQISPFEVSSGEPQQSAASEDASEELKALLSRLEGSELVVDPDASGLYTDFSITEYKLRLYALIWAVDASETSELSLVLILGPIAGSYLPMGTQISVKEKNLLVAEQNLRWTSNPTYLYTQVFGSWEEQFTIEIFLPNARPFSLSPLVFKTEPSGKTLGAA
ncbi:MAG: DUF1822 family protein [Cyanobacteria bacterium P01_F01_bin.53]